MDAMDTATPLVVPELKRGRRRSARAKVSELWEFRELLKSLVIRDLKVRYKNSVLGFAWSMLTPLALMIVFTFIFTKVIPVGGREDFPVFFLAGFLAWQFFANSVANAVTVIVVNSSLVKKVYFPREFLPIATVLSQLIHLVLSLGVLFVYLAFQRFNFLPFLPLLLLTMVIHTVFVAGISMAFAACNVRFRDLQELTPVIFLLWFYGTPIFYGLDMVPEQYKPVLMLNPMTWYLDLYRHALYYLEYPSARVLGFTALFAAVSFVAGYSIFTRLDRNFAKEV
ncbi:MAG TPA: ABC transporter permease [Actinomycetota bacterium]|nr:ABC transporter permease [Actinomycetota bacterium]